MGKEAGETVAHVLWWVLHIAGVVTLLNLPTDFTLAKGLELQHWVVAVALSLNILGHYGVRFSDPGWCSPPTAAAPGARSEPKPAGNCISASLALAATAHGASACSHAALYECEANATAISTATNYPSIASLKPQQLAPTYPSWPAGGCGVTSSAGDTATAGAPTAPAPAWAAQPSSAASYPTDCPLCGCVRWDPTITHCRYCDRCVEGFDHHCMWLGVCVGRCNHHLFARYLVVQAFVCFLGFHYTLTACGRSRIAGGAIVYWLLCVTGGLTILVTLLAATHVVLVLTGQTSRQVVNRAKAIRGQGSRSGSVSRGSAGSGAGGLGDGGEGGGGGGSGGSGAGQGRLVHVATVLVGQQGVTAGWVLANAVFLVAGVRPAWLTQSGWMQRADVWVARCVNNRYYSCC